MATNTQMQNYIHNVTVNGGVAQIGNIYSGQQSLLDDDRTNLLERLKPPDLHARQTQITLAFPQTYEWLFEAKSTHGFTQWLEQDSTIFWIKGKAGSGKSTLSKFICQHESLMPSLCTWAGHDRVLLLQHYFWQAGIQSQNTLAGFLRSLLYQALVQDTDLYRGFADLPTDMALWTNSHLESVLSTILNHSGRFVLLVVDGLDEFMGDSAEQDSLINIIKQASALSNVKSCITSRVSRYFEDSFGNEQNLALHDMTANDISLLVRGRLDRNQTFQAIAAQDTHKAQLLVQKVCWKAEGVFLWVHLAVEDLMRGLKKHDSLNDLEARIEFLDSSLEGLFLSLVAGIDRVHREKARAVFQLRSLASRAQSPDPLPCDPIPLNVLNAALAASSDSELPHLGCSSTEINAAALFQKLQDFSDVLNDHTAGLLEIRHYDPAHGFCRESSPQFCGARRLEDCICMDLQLRKRIPGACRAGLAVVLRHFSTKRIEYIHKSAHQFLEHNPVMQDFYRSNHGSGQHDMSVRASDAAQLVATLSAENIVAHAAHRGLWSPEDFSQDTSEVQADMRRTLKKSCEKCLTYDEFAFEDFVRRLKHVVSIVVLLKPSTEVETALQDLFHRLAALFKGIKEDFETISNATGEDAWQNWHLRARHSGRGSLAALCRLWVSIDAASLPRRNSLGRRAFYGLIYGLKLLNRQANDKALRNVFLLDCMLMDEAPRYLDLPTGTLGDLHALSAYHSGLGNAAKKRLEVNAPKHLQSMAGPEGLILLSKEVIEYSIRQYSIRPFTMRLAASSTVVLEQLLPFTTEPSGVFHPFYTYVCQNGLHRRSILSFKCAYRARDCELSDEGLNEDEQRQYNKALHLAFKLFSNVRNEISSQEAAELYSTCMAYPEQHCRPTSTFFMRL